MTTFDDVYGNDWYSYVKIYELKELLIGKLEKCGMEVDHEAPFADLIHTVKDIPSIIYDIRGNVMPTDELKPIDNEHSIMRFEIDLWQRIKYYNKWLRYYLVLKGVPIDLINRVSTLKEHILLIDRIDMILKTILAVNPKDTLNYATKNPISYKIVTTAGEPVTDGYIIVEQNGQIVKKVSVGDELTISPPSNEQQTYTFYYEGTEKYTESNHITRTFEVEAGDIVCNVEMVNLNSESSYYLDDHMGYADDGWGVIISTMTGNDIPLGRVMFDIYINDRLYMEDLETSIDGFYALEIFDIDAYGDVSIYVETKIEDENINNVRTKYELTILYDAFAIVQKEDYTGKDSYTFEIAVQDEYDGYLYSNALNGEEICYQFLDIQNCVQIEDGSATFTYNDNIEAGEYPISWYFNGKEYDDIVTIKSNFTLPDKNFFYLNDYPQIRYNPNGVIEENKKVGVQILHYGEYLYNESGEDAIALEADLEQAIEEYNAIGFFRTDENGYIILPEELRLITNATLMLNTEFDDVIEQIEYSYEISAPFMVERIEYIRQEHMKYRITVFDKEDFDIEAPMKNYITINKRSGVSLDYIYSIEGNSDAYYVYVNAVLADNPRLMGKNYFNVVINGYRHQEDFKLYNTTYYIVDPENLTVGNNEIQVECYDEAIDTIVITGEGISMEGFVDDDGLAIVRGTIDKPGTYMVNICGTGACDMPVCEEHEIIVPKYKLSLIDFGDWDNPIGSGDNSAITIRMENCPIEEEIFITFYYDTPLNEITSMSFQVPLSYAEKEASVFLSQILPPGRHTVYAQFNGESEYYDAFVYQASANVLISTHLTANPPEEIEVGEDIILSLLTLDYNNNIISDGIYIINGVEYAMDDEIILTPDILGEFRIDIEYQGVDIYDDCQATYIVNVKEYVYDYYISSLIGDNSNHGRNPLHPVYDLNQAIEISNATDTICAMAGSITKESIDRDLILFGYDRDAMEDIYVSLRQLAPHTKIVVKNIMLDTGNGYVPINEKTTFINNSDGYIDIDAIPHTGED